MKRYAIGFLCCTFYCVFLIDSANASCEEQKITAVFDNYRIGTWSWDPVEIHPIKLRNGFNLGVQIEYVSEETYRDLYDATKESTPEGMLRVALYDLGAANPKLIYSTWGHMNSRQKFGMSGEAVPLKEIAGLALDYLCTARAEK